MYVVATICRSPALAAAPNVRVDHPGHERLGAGAVATHFLMPGPRKAEDAREVTNARVTIEDAGELALQRGEVFEPHRPIHPPIDMELAGAAFDDDVRRQLPVQHGIERRAVKIDE